MVQGENIKIRVQIGNVNHPQTFVRAQVHSDANERSKIAAACGCQPENESLVVRVHNGVSDADLDQIFKVVTQSTYTDLKSGGKLQEFSSGNEKFIKVPLAQIGGGVITQSVVPVLAQSENLSGKLDMAMESDVAGKELADYKGKNLSMIYPLLKSYRIQATTNLNKEQLKAIADLINQMFGYEVGRFESFFGSTVNAEILFDSWEEVPQDLRAGLMDCQHLEGEKNLKALLDSPFKIISQPTEVHIFVNDHVMVKISAHFPDLNLLA
jgi:hypothetical protein